MEKDKFGNGIYELTEEEKELISEHEKFYKDIFGFGNNILDYAFSGTNPDYELTIYSYIYRILELLDTLKVMTDSSLINSGLIIVRSLFESSVQLCYICSDKTQKEKRAIILQLFDIKRSYSDVNIFKLRVGQYSCYQQYIDCVIEKKYNNWYSYCEDKRINLKQLCGIIGWNELYQQLYMPLSLEAHEINHMETNIVYENSKFNFKPFRMFENHILLLNCVLSIISPLFSVLVKEYASEDIMEQWNSYNNKIQKYIKNNHDISKLEKLFNPLLKWF